MGKKVVVGMSGGVDSSVAAYLLKEQGYEVLGVTMILWQTSRNLGISQAQQEGNCGGDTAVEDAKAVCDALGIIHDVVDFRSQFREKVIDYFISAYNRGNTPNPCIACNYFMKWEALLAYAREHGADCIATGHYARILQLENGRYTVSCAASIGKDQSYVLYRLTQEQLAHTLMPLGDYEKTQIRAIAEKIALPVANKRDSQDICFVPDGDYAGFIRQITGKCEPEGNFVDIYGNIMGKHCGISHYTIGQRKGLGISYTEPLFVKEIRSKSNEVVLCSGEGLYTDTCIVEDVNFMAVPGLEKELEAVGRIRYSHRGAECLIIPLESQKIECRFREPQRAITPGQAAVFYQNGFIACGGTIKS